MSASSGRMILRDFRQHIEHGGGATGTVLAQLERLAFVLYPEMAGEFAEALLLEETKDGAWNQIIERFVTTLQFRREMLEELKR